MHIWVTQNYATDTLLPNRVAVIKKPVTSLAHFYPMRATFSYLSHALPPFCVYNRQRSNILCE